MGVTSEYVLHRDSYMSQRTFNEINACLADEQCEEDMEPEPAPKSKRGRKRQSDETCLPEGERIRKEKNRKAAQKCREKKEKEAKDLKNRNEELEADNKKLSDDKKRLEEKTREFHRIIKDHIDKGCQLPPDVQELYNEDTRLISSYPDPDEAFRAVGIIERDHTPPHTPVDFSRDNVSPNQQCGFLNQKCFSGVSPTALFSGTPLLNNEAASRSDSSSRSSSSSPSSSMSRTNIDLQITRQRNALLFSNKSNQPPTTSSRQVEPSHHGDMDQPTHSSGQIVPTVVSELDDESDSTTEYQPLSFSMLDTEGKSIGVLQMSNNWTTGGRAKLASSGSVSPMEEERSQNLSSLGFTCPSDYSYTKDLQQMESVQAIIGYTGDGNGSQSQGPISEKKGSSGQLSGQCLGSDKKSPIGPSSCQPGSQPAIDVNVGAQALLDMAPEMAESLRQQIKSNYFNSFSSGIMLPSGENQLNGLKQQATSNQVQAGQQQIYLLKQKQCTPSEQPTNLEAHKKEQSLGGRPLFSQGSSGQAQIIIKPGVSSKMNCAVPSQRSSQQQEASHPSQCQEPHNFQRQLSVQIPYARLAIRLSQEQETPQSYAGNQVSQGVFPQGRQQQLGLVTTDGSLSRFLMSQAHPSNSNSPITSTQALGYTLPNPDVQSRPALQPQSLAYPCSGSPQNSQLASQQSHVFKPAPSNEFFKNVQIREGYTHTAAHPSAVQESSLGVDSSTCAAENIDYGANVQDLPSLNFLELQSDSNLFEKKPSRLAS